MIELGISRIREKGMVLPLVIVLSLVILTSLGFWYRKTIVQSFLSERLIEQRIKYNECKSLIPVLRQKLDDTPSDDLMHDDEVFLIVSVSGVERWRVARSRIISGKVIFTFSNEASFQDPIRLTLSYNPPGN